jgi:excisionase family DNA binding protein
MGTNPQVESQEVGSEEGSMKEWLNLHEVQEILGIGRTKVYELVATGQIPSVRIGRSIRINRRRLEEWLDQQTFMSQR